MFYNCENSLGDHVVIEKIVSIREIKSDFYLAPDGSLKKHYCFEIVFENSTKVNIVTVRYDKEVEASKIRLGLMDEVNKFYKGEK